MRRDRPLRRIEPAWQDPDPSPPPAPPVSLVRSVPALLGRAAERVLDTLRHDRRRALQALAAGTGLMALAVVSAPLLLVAAGWIARAAAAAGSFLASLALLALAILGAAFVLALAGWLVLAAFRRH